MTSRHIAARERFAAVARAGDLERALVGAAMAVVGIAAVIASFSYGLTSERGGIGPGTVPLVAGTGFAIEGLLVCGKAIGGFRRFGKDDGEVSGDPPRPGMPPVGGLIQALCLVAMLGVVLVLTPYVGFIPMIVLFGLVVGLVVEKASWRASLLLGLVSGGFIWLVFIILLDVRIPAIGPAT